VDAPVEVVGLDPDGAMGAPRRFESVGWYGLGPIPGEEGAAVMGGHVDSKDGPAVFWSLKDLRPGDEVAVDLSDGRTVVFAVEGSGWYTPSEAPLQSIFARDGTPRLNLVTCGGVFDRRNRAYTHRLVIYTRAIPAPTATAPTTAPFATAVS
jgi:sortase (surface protein transpeptidase)